MEFAHGRMPLGLKEESDDPASGCSTGQGIAQRGHPGEAERRRRRDGLQGKQGADDR